MLDPKFVIDNLTLIEGMCKKRRVSFDINKFKDVYENYKRELSVVERLKADRSEITKRIKSDSGVPNHELLYVAKSLKDNISLAECKCEEAKEALNVVLLNLPNLISDDVPSGDPKYTKFCGNIRSDVCKEDHISIVNRLELVDFTGGSKVSGSGFCYLKNEAVLLELALIRYAFDLLSQHGFSLLSTPDLVIEKAVLNTGFVPRGPESQTFMVDGGLCLIGTSEISVANLFVDTLLSKGDLPFRYGAVSHCFRKESGSYGRESKGLYRLKQFSKVEMFIVSSISQSDDELDRLVSIQESFVGSMCLPYRVCLIHTEDLGAPAYKKIDIEVWMPSRNDYGEVSSASNCTDFQSRRLNLRYKENASSKSVFAHTLNATAVAVPRIILAILENNLISDGSIKMPDVLVPYLGFSEITEKRNSKA